MQHYHAILTAPFDRRTAPGRSCAGGFSTFPTRMDAQERPPSLAVGGKTAPAFSTTPLASLSPSLAVAWPKLGIRMQGEALCALDFVAHEMDDVPAINPHAAEVVRQLLHYFADPAYQFSIPLASVGTPFQQRVWQALRDVPAGQPCRYGDLARRLSSGPRAIGGACRANPVPIVVPCHRIVGATGLGGYSGVAGLDSAPELAIKRWLLDHERS